MSIAVTFRRLSGRSTASATGGARLVSRIALSDAGLSASYLLVLCVAAQRLTPAMIGVAAGALALAALSRALTEIRAGALVTAADPESLGPTLRNARRALWIYCGGVFLLQLGLAGLLRAGGADPELWSLVALLALELPFLPETRIREALVRRAGYGPGSEPGSEPADGIGNGYKTRPESGPVARLARIEARRVLWSNLAAALCILALPVAAALVLPRLLAAPMLLWGLGRLPLPRPSAPASGRVLPLPMAPFLHTGSIHGTPALIEALRRYGDKLVVGAMLGAAAMGTYALAAGLGICLARMAGLGAAGLLGAGRSGPARGAVLPRLVALTSILVVTALVPLLAAPALGPDWIASGSVDTGIVPLIVLFSLATIPALFWSCASERLRATELRQVEGTMTLGIALALIANTAMLAPYGLVAIAEGYLAVAVLTQMIGGAIILSPALRTSHSKAH